ncbi:MAG: FAD-dependent oxidoreductase [Geodermatophilales bacterium]|nr:FAD-dependent oxidoreductase [Geodermatophilales bacterium]
MAKRIVIIGGGAAGIGAAGAARGTDRDAEITVYTEYEDAAYSPCGIPYVHGGEIPDFERLFLGTKQQYAEQGIDIRYQTAVRAIDPRGKNLRVGNGPPVPYDALVIATGWGYGRPDVPGADLATDPDIVAPVQESWEEMGARLHFNTKLEAILGDEAGRVRAVATTDGEIPCDLVVVCTHKEPRTDLGRAAGLAVGSAGGFVVDETMATSVTGVWAAGDCAEIPHGVSNVPIQGLSGSHAYAQGKVAGVNAAGGRRAYQPVYVPWAMVAGKWMIGGVSFSETLATALGIPFVVGQAQGISRARYFPDVKPVKVKLLAEPDRLRLIGAQMVGGEGIKERADFLAMAVRKGITLRDLATMENVYSPPIGALNEPIAMAAQDALARLGS